MVIMEGGQLFLQNFSHQKAFKPYQDIINYFEEQNKKGITNPENSYNENLEVFFGMIDTLKKKLEDYIDDPELLKLLDFWCEKFLNLVIEAKKAEPSEEVIKKLLKEIKEKWSE